MAIKRKAPSTVKRVSFADKLVEAHLILNSINSHIASMDTERTSLEQTKQHIEVVNMVEIKGKIKSAHDSCDKLSATYKADATGECATAKKLACDAINVLNTAVAGHNANVQQFNDVYKVLADHMQFNDTQAVNDMLDTSDVSFLGC